MYKKNRCNTERRTPSGSSCLGSSNLQELQRFCIYPFLLYLCTVESQQHYMVTVAEWLRRKFVELVYMGSSPICHTNPAG